MADRAPDPRMLAVLKKAVGVLQEEGIPFALAGSMACWALGGPPSRHDVDLALLQSDAERALEALAAAGFRIERPPEGWLVKVWDDGILVDLIWAPMGLRVTHEVLRAARPVNVDGMPVPALAPTEDFFLRKRLGKLKPDELKEQIITAASVNARILDVKPDRRALLRRRRDALDE